jgi:hypothetical protein
MKLYNFLLLWFIFALLDPDSEYRSGSTDPIESGSNSDPDPQPCKNLQKSWWLPNLHPYPWYLNLAGVLRHALNLTQQLVCAKRFSMLEAEKLITRVSFASALIYSWIDPGPDS